MYPDSDSLTTAASYVVNTGMSYATVFGIAVLFIAVRVATWKERKVEGVEQVIDAERVEREYFEEDEDFT